MLEVCGPLSSLDSFVSLLLLLTWEFVFLIPVKVTQNSQIIDSSSILKNL